jgi:hypothetical protein
MVRVALHLRRSTGVALDEYPACVAVQFKGAGEVKRLAGDEFFWLVDVRDDLFWRLTGASGQARERKRGAGKLKESASIDALRPDGSLLGKLPMKDFVEVGIVLQLFETAPELASRCSSKSGFGRVDEFVFILALIWH